MHIKTFGIYQDWGAGGAGLQACGAPTGCKPCLVLLGTESRGSQVVAFEGLPLSPREGSHPQGLLAPAEWGMCLQRASGIHRRGAKWASWRRGHLIRSLGAGPF